MGTTNLPLEERLGIVHELILATIHNNDVLLTDNACRDAFYLIGAIIEDTKHPSTNHTKLIVALKRTPVWQRVLPFLDNEDSKCARKGCGCGSWCHTKGKKCTGEKLVKLAAGEKPPKGWRQQRWAEEYYYRPCECPGFVQREFK